MHQMPRFGHASDFSKLFSKDEDEVTDYALGLIFGGALVITFFVIWLLVILVFKCLGQRRVGFLSGAPFTKTPEISAVGGNVRRPMITRCKLNFHAHICVQSSLYLVVDLTTADYASIQFPKASSYHLE